MDYMRLDGIIKFLGYDQQYSYYVEKCPCLRKFMLKYLELKCYDVCNLLSEVSERERKTNVGKMSTTGKLGL